MKNQNEKKLPEGAVAAAATCYAAFEGEGGEWGVEQHGCVVYDACCGFDEDTAELMAEVMNEGKGLDAWCEHEDENADLLRDRLIERGWVDPMRHNTPDHGPEVPCIGAVRRRVGGRGVVGCR